MYEGSAGLVVLLVQSLVGAILSIETSLDMHQGLHGQTVFWRGGAVAM
jgi:hypothetical protein